jgi:hypothetical protein
MEMDHARVERVRLENKRNFGNSKNRGTLGHELVSNRDFHGNGKIEVLDQGCGTLGSSGENLVDV